MTESEPHIGNDGSGRLSQTPDHTKTQSITRLPGGSALPRSSRGFSRKLQDMIKKQRTSIDNDLVTSDTKGKFEPRNWKQLSDRELSKLSLMERSRYLAYEPTPKEMVEKCQESRKRVRVNRESERALRPSIGEAIEYERNNELVGQLKSAEARQRIRYSRMQYQCYREEELAHLISSQPSAIEAVRLQSFIAPVTSGRQMPDTLNQHQRIRCETILEDEKGLTINRTQ
ncbi:uncharacterized protein LOC135331497 [Halichondria panicea]|uniref:uncharacterized protein LOC135331497 n=1 Tax=Halichondria panicea TaxID=6063 RepID=UPI00312BBFCA